MVLQPFYGLLATFNSSILLSVGDVLDYVIRIVLVIPFDPATSNNEEITRLELHAFVLGDLFQIFYGYAMPGHGVVLDAPALAYLT